MSTTVSPTREALPGDKSSRLAKVSAAVLPLAGAALAGTALLIRRAAKHAEKRHPPTGRFVEADGVRLHYLELGEGKPVVLVHGNGTMARDFLGSGLTQTLARRYRVVAFDRPGFGYSERPRSRVWTADAQAELLLAAFTNLGLVRPIVVAHSWGTLVALAMALRDPDAVRGLLLISGYYYPTPRLDPLWQSPPAIPLVGDVMRYTISPLLARAIIPLQARRMFAPAPVPEAFWRAVPLEMMLRPWHLRAAAGDAATMVPTAASLARRYGRLTLPLTLAAGGEDKVAYFSTHTARLHAQLPHSKLLPFPGAGHMLHYTATAQLASAVDELFARSAASAAQQPHLEEPALATAPAEDLATVEAGLA